MSVAWTWSAQRSGVTDGFAGSDPRGVSWARAAAAPSSSASIAPAAAWIGRASMAIPPAETLGASALFSDEFRFASQEPAVVNLPARSKRLGLSSAAFEHRFALLHERAGGFL